METKTKTKRIIINSVFFTLYVILYLVELKFKLFEITINNWDDKHVFYRFPLLLSPVIALIVLPHFLSLRIFSGQINLSEDLENTKDSGSREYIWKLCFYSLGKIIFAWSFFAIIFSVFGIIITTIFNKSDFLLIDEIKPLQVVFCGIIFILPIYFTRKVYFFVFFRKKRIEKTINDKTDLLKIIEEGGYVLGDSTHDVKSDREIVLAAVKKNGKELQHASYSLKSDREVVMAAVSQNGEALRFASKSFKSDREVVMAAVSQDGRALRFASDSLKSDREVVMAAVIRNGYALKYASKDLQKEFKN